jgi:hypothetical protein
MSSTTVDAIPSIYLCQQFIKSIPLSEHVKKKFSQGNWSLSIRPGWDEIHQFAFETTISRDRQNFA